MDKLKAIQYFAAAAQSGSLARAAERLELSVPAVQKVITGLERDLGVTLLERGARGVRLTATGSEYLDRCHPLLAQLDELTHVEARLRGDAKHVSGTLTVAAHPQLAHHILLPALPRFHARYPDVEIDFRTVNRIGDVDAQTAEVLLLHGWPEVPPDCVHRSLGGAHNQIMASPEYWAAHDVPQHPSDLSRHNCLLMRNPSGILLDLWEFARGKERVSVPVRGWMTTNAREALLDLVVAGHGVARFGEVTTRSHIQSGRLVPALLDWEVQGGAPVNLVYKASARKNPRARVFIDFALECVRDLIGADDFRLRTPNMRPAWHIRGYGRASATLKSR